MKVLVTGANGFIGKNLSLKLKELKTIEVLTFIRGDDDIVLTNAIEIADIIVHLAGENRPDSPDKFDKVNRGLTKKICDALYSSRRKTPLLLASSTQAEINNPYGVSKLAAEHLVCKLNKDNFNPVAIYRLTGIFGKWSKPNYNSVVATFCYNIAHELPIQISDPDEIIRLVYIDDVIRSILNWIRDPGKIISRLSVEPEYRITLGNLARQIRSFSKIRSDLVLETVGMGLTRALYSTYVSYISPRDFLYDLPVYKDERGVFVEMLKTSNAGQFSFFTAFPGVTRGGHYHHTKTEKFLVIKGKARFGFRNMATQEVYYLETSGDKPQIVETIPGWAHDIKNIGNEELIVMLWANEIFDPQRPDTIACKV